MRRSSFAASASSAPSPCCTWPTWMRTTRCKENSPLVARVREVRREERRPGGDRVRQASRANSPSSPEADRAGDAARFAWHDRARPAQGGARGAYDLLGLQSYYTAGPKEIRAWPIHKGCTAPQAAGVIHSDFERGFIRAEIYTVADLQEYKTRRPSAPPARCASRARTTSCPTATSATSCSAVEPLKTQLPS
jgi:hypothetical protein